jgi:hypothetical protein
MDLYICNIWEHMESMPEIVHPETQFTWNETDKTKETMWLAWGYTSTDSSLLAPQTRATTPRRHAHAWAQHAAILVSFEPSIDSLFEQTLVPTAAHQILLGFPPHLTLSSPFPSRPVLRFFLSRRWSHLRTVTTSVRLPAQGPCWTSTPSPWRSSCLQRRQRLRVGSRRRRRLSLLRESSTSSPSAVPRSSAQSPQVRPLAFLYFPYSSSSSSPYKRHLQERALLMLENPLAWRLLQLVSNQSEMLPGAFERVSAWCNSKCWCILSQTASRKLHFVRRCSFVSGSQ